MFNLSEYRKNPDRLADVLPWVALIAPGVVLNKDGSFQRTLRFRGPDTASSTDSQLVAVMARLNNALKRLTSGWVIYIEAARKPSISYPHDNHYNDPVSWLIDLERRHQFEQHGSSFETDYYLTLQFLPSASSTSKLSHLLIPENDDAKASTGHQKDLQVFITMTDRFCDTLKEILFESYFLNDEETLTYLHSAISTKNHRISVPDIPTYLDVTLADTPLLGGTAPQLGDHHLRTISFLTFPGSTQPALLDQLNQLPFTYRWVTRFISIDKIDAEAQLKRYKKQWFAKRKGMFNLLQEAFSKNESRLQDSSAVKKSGDADEALNELMEDYVSYGYYTSTVTVMDPDRQTVESMQRSVERVINGLGFTSIVETFNAVEAWLSSLPGQAYANIRTPLLHSLNLAHLMPFSAIWPGPINNAHLNAPPVMVTHTTGRTPFRFVNHINDVGHHMVIGPTGAGKSVFLTLLALQFKRYRDAQIFIFDKGGSFLAPTAGVSGEYYELGIDKKHLAFQPLSHIDQEEERVWAAEWLQYLLLNEQVTVTGEVKKILWEALMDLSYVPPAQRSITGLVALIQSIPLREALTTYTIEGPFGHLFDASYEEITDADWQCYEMEGLMGLPSVLAPTLTYLFHRLSKRFTGRPTLLILDEAWLFLDNPIFSSKIRDWLKSLRKQNVSVIFATQSAEDALASAIAPTLLESCPARTLLPNDRLLEGKTRQIYEQLGLNEKQLHMLATATPKRQYYFQSRLGNRLFDVELGEIALAFCAASKPEERKVIHDLLNQYGSDHFLSHYLKLKNLEWAENYLADFYASIGETLIPNGEPGSAILHE
jgi:type IV secretion/conjugal transfer VirB4 family ATPase